MAHPMLIRRGDRRTLLAAGTAAALLTAPILAAPAASAIPLDGLAASSDCDPDAVAGDAALARQCADAGLLSGVTEILPEPLRGAVDPIEKVVDDVLKQAPAPVKDVVEGVGEVVEGVTGGVGDAVDGVTGGVGDAVEGVTGGVGEVLPTEAVDVVPEAVVPAPEVGTAGTPRPVAPVQGPGVATPPFIARGVASDTTTTQSARPFAAPVVSGPIFGTLPQVAEEFLTRAPVAFSSDALAALRGPGSTTAPGPDSASWLFATAAGMLLLVGAGHLVHARQRYTASIAR